MNAVTQDQQGALAEVAAAQSAVDAMAVVTLSPERYAAEVYQPFADKLKAAIDSVRTVDYDIKTTTGMAVAIKARALFRDMRIAADKERVARKAPITKIGKLLESGYDQVEERITPLEELFDADIKAEEQRKDDEKAAKIAAELVRVENIRVNIDLIKSAPVRHLASDSTALQTAISFYTALPVTTDEYQEFAGEAENCRLATVEKLKGMQAIAAAAEQAAAEAEAARVAEAARLEAERQENARQRAENERIANEQAAERKRLADLAAAQEAALQKQRDEAAANLKAAADAQAEANRKEQAERDRVAAETKRQLDAQQAQIAAERKALDDERAAEAKKQADATRLEADHAEAMVDNAQFDADAADRLARCTETAQAMLTNGRSLVQPDAMALSLDAYAESGLADADDPSDEDIIMQVAESFGMTFTEALERVSVIAFAELRAELVAA